MNMSQPMQLLTSRASVDWYTPAWIIAIVREILSTIDLDPASCYHANQIVKATHYFSIADDGLAHYWYGNVFLNPPFDDTARWLDQLYDEYDEGRVKNAIVLVNSNLGYNWFEHLWSTHLVCCLRERVAFINADTGIAKDRAKRGQTLAYIGANTNMMQTFLNILKPYGTIILPYQQ